jgi:hypothetical protein
MQDALEAWRLNAWVRQVVRLTTAYVVGDGIQVGSPRRVIGPFVEEFWNHRQNQIDRRLAAWSDELSRSGELFLALFTNKVDGMQYVRAIPAASIQRVETDEEDYERETGYLETVPGQVEPKAWKSIHTAEASEPVLLHYCINKPVGATRGESDLTPLLPWARRYTEWLRGRVTYNKMRNDLATAEIILDDDSKVENKKSQYRSDPPTGGSVFIHGRGEELKFPAANIQGYDAEPDGKAIRLGMATAANVPLHFFAEGDSATRATAVEMGDPTHRHYRQRQIDFCYVLVDLVEKAFERRQAQRGVQWTPTRPLKIEAEAPDVSRADNKALAEAAHTIVETFALMKEWGWITDELAIRLSFKFAGEILSEEEIQSILEADENGGTSQNGVGDSGNVLRQAQGGGNGTGNLSGLDAVTTANQRRRLFGRRGE